MSEPSQETTWNSSASRPPVPASDAEQRSGSRDPGPPDDPGEIESSETYRLLTDAIDRQLVLLVRFEDETAPRRVCPDRIGIDPHDQYQVEAFQLSGPSESNTGTDAWKCFHLHSLQVMGVEEEGWALGPRETARSHCFEQVVYPAPGTE